MSHSHPPRVSVGLPVYNGENFVAQAIDSILGQTFADLELVISDNGSSDRTEEICRHYAAADERVRYFRSPVNRGVAWNFNRVFEVARGEYFKWAAHDDVNALTQIEQCVKLLDERPEVALASFRSAVIDVTGDLIVAAEGSSDDCELQGVPAYKEEARLRHSAALCPATRYRGVLLDSIRCYEVFGLMRSEMVRSSGMHGAYRGSEKVFLGELALRGTFAEIPEVLFFSRWHNARYSANPSAQAQAEHFQPGSTHRRWVLPFQLRCAQEHCRMLGRQKLSFAQKTMCLGVLARWVLQPSKWARILAKLMLGQGDSVALPDDVQRVGRHPNFPVFPAGAVQAPELQTANHS